MENKKKVMIRRAVIRVPLISYLLVSFAQWSLNPATWSVFGRVFFVVFVIGFAAAVVSRLKEVKNGA